MRGLLERSRFATLLAVGLALLVSGVVAGAAGGNFILGQSNSAGTSNTSLTTSSTGNALLVTQNGTGTAIRGSTGSGSGIAGFFTVRIRLGGVRCRGEREQLRHLRSERQRQQRRRRRHARQRQGESRHRRHE